MRLSMILKNIRYSMVSHEKGLYNYFIPHRKYGQALPGEAVTNIH